MTQDELINLARVTARKHGLDESLVCALCDHESGGWNTWAIRHENAFFDKYVAPLYAANKLSITEAYARAFSYGLGQVMGQTARELGFTGLYLTELCDPAVGLEYACRKLQKCFGLSHGDRDAALLKYNGGGDLSYVKDVTSLLFKYNFGNNAAQVSQAATNDN